MAVPLGNLSAEAVRAIRGTPQDALTRIRGKYQLADTVPDDRIFFHACRNFHGIESAHSFAALDHEQFVKEGVLPHYMWRCADEDVFYQNMVNLS